MTLAKCRILTMLTPVKYRMKNQMKLPCLFENEYTREEMTVVDWYDPVWTYARGVGMISTDSPRHARDVCGR